MAYGYVIAQIDVTDPQRYPEYVRQVQPTLDLFGGVFIVRGGAAEFHEAEPLAGERVVVIRFPSLQAARDWYHSDAYRPVRALRQAASTSLQIIVEGV